MSGEIGPVQRPGQAKAAEAIGLRLNGDANSVRRALLRMADDLVRQGLSEAHAATAELVLAEVLNNVVEHAFAGRTPGHIDIALTLAEGAVACEVSDDGHPMPEDALPLVEAPRLSHLTVDLPEGGFGWFLIYSLAEGLAYERSGNRNILRFRVPVADTAPKP